MATTRLPALSFRLGEPDIDLIRRLAARLSETTGVDHSQTDVIRLAVRLLGRRERLSATKKPAK